MPSTVGKVITCRAAVLWEANKPYVIEEVQVAPPKAHEVRVKIVASGVCHTDAYNFGDFENPGRFPVIRGHEGGGIVESVGLGVTGFMPGDHVIPIFMPLCKNCELCKSDKTNLCSSLDSTQGKGVMPDGTSRFSCRGRTVYHFMGTSTFTEYTVVSEISLCKINDKAPLDKVCLLGCGVSTGYGSALNNAQVEPGSSCAIWGLGAVGLACAMGCKKAGATKIYGIDINPAKKELAKKFGITEFINPKDVEDKGPLQKYLTELTNGGFDYTFACVGNVDTMRVAFESARKGWGTAVVVGVDPSGREISTLPYQLKVGRKWIGSAFGGWKSTIDVPKLVEEYMKKDLMVDEFITHVMELEDINEAFKLMLAGKSIHSVLTM